MPEDVFEMELDSQNTGSFIQLNPLVPESEPSNERSTGGQHPGCEEDIHSEYRESKNRAIPPPLATSLPVAIPARMISKIRENVPEEANTAEFMPPHTFSYKQSFSTFAGSLPLSSSSRIRARTRILQSTGMLPTNSTVGFLVSRTKDTAKEELKHGAAINKAAESVSLDETALHRSTGDAG